jgi:hypothetical protein
VDGETKERTLAHQSERGPPPVIGVDRLRACVARSSTCAPINHEAEYGFRSRLCARKIDSDAAFRHS